MEESDSPLFLITCVTASFGSLREKRESAMWRGFSRGPPRHLGALALALEADPSTYREVTEQTEWSFLYCEKTTSKDRQTSPHEDTQLLSLLCTGSWTKISWGSLLAPSWTNYLYSICSRHITTLGIRTECDWKMKCWKETINAHYYREKLIFNTTQKHSFSTFRSSV